MFSCRGWVPCALATLSLCQPSWGLTVDAGRSGRTAFCRNLRFLHCLQNEGQTVRAEATSLRPWGPDHYVGSPYRLKLSPFLFTWLSLSHSWVLSSSLASSGKFSLTLGLYPQPWTSLLNSRPLDPLVLDISLDVL